MRPLHSLVSTPARRFAITQSPRRGVTRRSSSSARYVRRAPKIQGSRSATATPPPLLCGYFNLRDHGINHSCDMRRREALVLLAGGALEYLGLIPCIIMGSKTGTGDYKLLDVNDFDWRKMDGWIYSTSSRLGQL